MKLLLNILESFFLCSELIAPKQTQTSTKHIIGKFLYFRNDFLGSARSSGDDMKCYSEKDGSKFQLCQKRLGYRTCFAQYDKGNVSDNSSQRKEWFWEKDKYFQRAQLWGEDAQPKIQCFTLSVKTMWVGLKVSDSAIAAIICAIIRKRLAKVSRSCSGWASLLPPWPRDAAEAVLQCWYHDMFIVQF